MTVPSRAAATNLVERHTTVTDWWTSTSRRGASVAGGSRTADVLLRALADGDPELALHLGGVAELSCATALRLATPYADLEEVRLTALLHDLGKVAIPEEILRKPGPLDADEWALMKRHTIIGERIIRAAPALAAVARLVRSTHERHDGGGYPDGLAGTEIPLAARIVAACDAYDAMVTDRPYRSAMSEEEARAELRACAGTQFDPEVVNAVLAVLDARGRRAGPPSPE